MMSVPTRGETYSKLLEHVRMCEEHCAMMAHLHNTEGNAKDVLLAKGWLAMSESFRKTSHLVIKLAQGNLQ